MSTERHPQKNAPDKEVTNRKRPEAKGRTRKGKDILEQIRSAQKEQKPSVQKQEKASRLPKSEPQNLKARLVTVSAANEGQRLDNFLITLLKGVPKSHIYRMVRNGEVRINKGRVKVEARLKAGDLVRIPPIRVEEKLNSYVPPIKSGDMPNILFEDKDLLIVEKPAGMACHGGSGISYGLIERMRTTFGPDQFLELAHRLDRDTSGVIILAKSRRALVRLHEMMREGEVQKVYLTLVKGDWVNDRQHVKLPLHKFLTASGERRVKVDKEEGLPSHSIFTLIERFGQVSYLEVELKTGRTHQIRVHAQASGFPLVGDDKYGDFDFNAKVEQGLLGVPFKRMFLHAHRLTLNHPISGDKLIIESPLPEECKQLIEVLEKNAK